MARVNIVKQIKVDGKWVLRSIPKRPTGHYDWTVLPEGTYFIEWRENGQRKREPAGITAAQAIEAQRRRRHELEERRWNPAPWGILALMAYAEKVLDFSDALPRATDALLARLEKNRGALDTSTLAVCALALEAVEGDNVFEVRR
jgi:hypothetical protein